MGLFLILSQLCCGVLSGGFSYFAASPEYEKLAKESGQQALLNLAKGPLVAGGLVLAALSLVGIFAGVGVFGGKRWAFNFACLLALAHLSWSAYTAIATKGGPDFCSIFFWLFVGWYCWSRLAGRRGKRPR